MFECITRKGYHLSRPCSAGAVLRSSSVVLWNPIGFRWFWAQSHQYCHRSDPPKPNIRRRVPNQAARHDKSRSSSVPTFSPAARPKTAAALTGRGKVETSKGLSSNWRVSVQNKPASSQHHREQQQQKQESVGKGNVSQTPEACGPHFARSIGSDREGTPRTARSGVEETQPLPQLQPAEATVAAAENRDGARASGSVERRRENDEAHVNSETVRNTAPSKQAQNGLLSKRPSTAPALPEKLTHLPGHESARAGRGIQGSTPGSTAPERQATAMPGCDPKGQFVGNASHRSTCSAGGSERSDDDSDANSVGHTIHKLRHKNPPKAARSPDAFAITAPVEHADHLATATNIFDAELDHLSPGSLRPSSAEARRRPSIEADASLSRSSRLPPPSCSLTPSSGLTRFTGSMVVVAGPDKHGGGGRGAQEARAEIGPGVDIIITGQPGGQRAKTQSRGRKGGTASTTKRRFRRQRGGKTGQSRRQRQRQQEQHSSSAAGSGSKPTFADSLLSSSLGRATGTTWTQWRRPGELGELDLQADFLHRTNGRGGRRQALGQGTNGATSGVGWGGHEQVRTVLLFLRSPL